MLELKHNAGMLECWNAGMLGCLPRETTRSVPAKQGFTGAGMLGCWDAESRGYPQRENYTREMGKVLPSHTHALLSRQNLFEFLPILSFLIKNPKKQKILECAESLRIAGQERDKLRVARKKG
jgi:hypothetical protein